MQQAQTGVFGHRITHRRPPVSWHDGFPLGNGQVGVMFWGDGNPLVLTLDHAALWDLRSDDTYMSHPDFSYAGLQRLVADGRPEEALEVFEARQLRDNPLAPTKVSIGRAEVHLGEVTGYECSLDLGTATVAGTIRTTTGDHAVRCFVHRERNVVCLRIGDCPADARLELVPLAEVNDTLAQLGHPPAVRANEGDLRVLTQSLLEGPSCAVVWNASGPDFVLAIEVAGSEGQARAKAVETWRAAAEVGLDGLLEEHVRAWECFWAGSAVYLPEERLEFLWYYGLYLLASAARRGAVPPGLQGLWAMDGVTPPWRGDYHADMNVQETFWPACASGHLDLLDSWCDLMRECLPAARDFTRRFFGTEGSFWPSCTLPRHTIVPCWYTVQFAWSHSGWLGWLVWLRWRYSMDPEWVAETGYPLVSEIFRFYRANLREEGDGYLHVPLSTSPEYRENRPEAWCQDPNVDLALIRRCCDWVIEMEEALGQDELSQQAREVRGKLAPYSLTPEGELCLWPGKPLDESHRHPSHLMAIHPAMDLTIEGDEEARRVIAASIERYCALGQYLWAGHTYAQLVSLAAVIGRGEFAYDCLLRFAEYWIGANGLHFNRDTRHTGTTGYRGDDRPFTMEANCAIAAGVSDMLVQGWGDTVRLFPAVPAHWRDVVFRDLLTEGAFRVSAIRREGRTVWARVRATVRRRLRLRDPFEGEESVMSGADARREGTVLIADLEEGQALTLRLPGWVDSNDEAAVLSDAVARIRTSDVSRLGLR